ncbi:MAG: PDGLE domain-containing protein [Candidatus Nanopelagicaceae bacterium]|jgi:cobalt/nickel transport protein
MKKLLGRFYFAFFVVSLIVAGALSYYASSHPDGLEKVAEDVGFLDTAKDSSVSGSPLADYGISGIENARLSVGLSGVIGVFATALVAYLVFAISKRLRKSK